ncbi:MAG: hypothetical protein KDD11_15375, partial [Acidobacteria bacterium]|nr:hypothetical protein [Acidobacteriota bacterium]
MRAQAPSDELDALEAQVDQLLRRVPPCAEAAEEEGRLRQRAAAISGLKPVEVRRSTASERAQLGDGSPSNVVLARWSYSGEATYEQVHDFLSRVGQFNRLVSLETADLAASADGVRYSLRLLYPCYSTAPEAAADTAATHPSQLLAARLEELRRTHQLLTELQALPSPAVLTDTLDGFEAQLGQEPLALTAVSKDGEVVLVEGVTRGAAARGAVQPALATAGLRILESRVSAMGACERFSIKATLGDGEPVDERLVGLGLFDARTDRSCEAPALPAESTARHFDIAGDTAPEDGGLTLHLRDVGVADVFNVLYQLTALPGRGFVVEPGTTERLSFDAENVTVDQLLEALSRNGVGFSPGPMYRVSTSGTKLSGLLPRRYSAEPISIFLQDQELPTILCALGLLSDRTIAYPRDLDQPLSLFVGNLPADEALDAVIAGAGLSTVTESRTLFVAPPQDIARRKTPGAFR